MLRLSERQALLPALHQLSNREKKKQPVMTKKLSGKECKKKGKGKMHSAILKVEYSGEKMGIGMGILEAFGVKQYVVGMNEKESFIKDEKNLGQVEKIPHGAQPTPTN